MNAPHRHGQARGDQGVVKLAILAVGGQGGGVLSDWIVRTAEEGGYAVQATSVPGVAQRTGATIYSIEMAPRSERQPVFALMPSPGDVDIVIAAELMEAGRAIMRGLVTPERTTLIASSHRVHAVSEKIIPGDGIADPDAVTEAARAASHSFISFDMQKVAVESRTIISASLFGALAGSGALPFPVEAYESAIRASGRGVDASLEAFHRARALAEGAEAETASEPPEPAALGPLSPTGPKREMEKWRALEARVGALPEPARDMAFRGLAKVVDFQDTAYGAEYLDRLEHVQAIDRRTGGEASDFALTTAAAKHIANAMAYDDVIRVADRKTRLSRFSRVNRELGVADDAIVHLTEFMHPRGEEVCGMLPARLGRWIEARPRAFKTLDRLVNRGRRVRSDSVLWFTVLSMLAGMRRWRRGLLRHDQEQAHLNDWLDRSLEMACANYGLAVEMINCRRLVKGYSDTHARGLSKFERVLDAAPLLRDRADGADWMRRLREAATKDEDGALLDGALATVRSFAETRDETLPAGRKPA